MICKFFFCCKKKINKRKKDKQAICSQICAWFAYIFVKAVPMEWKNTISAIWKALNNQQFLTS